jgi:uncharacterized protein
VSEGSRWRTHREGPYIRLHGGGKFHLKSPDLTGVRLETIAHHLAGVNRYTGASRYTVAQHCAVAAHMARVHYPTHPQLPAAMLVHDVAEAFYGDVSSPLKSMLPEYRALEFFADSAVERRLGVKFLGDPLVKEVDDRMWLTESRLLFGAEALEDYHGPLEPFSTPPGDRIGPGPFDEWVSYFAKIEWLREAEKEMFT